MFDRILLVDDDQAANFLSGTILQDMDAAKEIEMAEDGLQATRLIENGYCPDLIFLDIRMPRMDGFDFLEAFTQKGACQKTKVVMLTSSARQEDRQKALGYRNVIDYLEKPITEQVVKRISEQHFE